MSAAAAAWLRAGDIAKTLRVDVRTVRRWIADGTLPSVKIGGARLVAEEDLLRRLNREPAAKGPGPYQAETLADSDTKPISGKLLPSNCSIYDVLDFPNVTIFHPLSSLPKIQPEDQ